MTLLGSGGAASSICVQAALDGAREIDVLSINSRTSKSGVATISMTFQIQGTDELRELIAKIRTIDSIIDIERTTG